LDYTHSLSPQLYPNHRFANKAAKIKSKVGLLQTNVAKLSDLLLLQLLDYSIGTTPVHWRFPPSPWLSMVVSLAFAFRGKFLFDTNVYRDFQSPILLIQLRARLPGKSDQ
jgi:hypothetical protein